MTTETVSDRQHTKLFFEHLRSEISNGTIDMRTIAHRIGRETWEVQQAVYGGERIREEVRDQVRQEILLSLDNTMQNYIIDQLTVVETTQYSIAQRALERGMETPQFIIVIGAPGYGKSIAFKKFKRLHAEGVQFYTVLATDTARTLMQRISEDLGAKRMNNSSLSAPVLFPRIMAKMGVKRTMLVFDEGDRLTYKDLEWLRDVTDENEEFRKPRTSAVIFGNLNLLETVMTGNVNMSETRTMRSQLFRRVKIIKMPELNAEDVRLFIADRFPGVEVEAARAQDIAAMLTYDGGYGVIDEARRALANQVQSGKLKENKLTAAHVQDMIAKLTETNF